MYEEGSPPPTHKHTHIFEPSSLFFFALKTLTFILEYKGPPSGTSSAKQSPALQHRVLGQRSAGVQDEQ